VLKVVELPDQGHAGVQQVAQDVGVNNGGLEEGKPVRIASRMLDAKLIELYFRLNDQGGSWRLFFPEVKWSIQHDSIMNTYRALQLWKHDFRSYARTTRMHGWEASQAANLPMKTKLHSLCVLVVVSWDSDNSGDINIPVYGNCDIHVSVSKSNTLSVGKVLIWID
jgi:hypothetical protein